MKMPVRLIIILIASLGLTTACGPSIESLEEDVKKAISADADLKPGVFVKSVSLVKKGGNEYTGIIELTDGSETVTADLEVTVDGSRFIWKIKE